MAGNALYTEKESGYYGEVRNDVLDIIPITPMRILDVGCGSGDTALAAKRRFGPSCEVTGIEMYEPAGMAARNKLDRVIIGDIEHLTLDFPEKHFDCILCSDILEHLKDPWTVLNTLRRFLADDGVFVASMPNIRHIVPLKQIILDRLEYQKSGVLDKTHLRIFTLHTIRGLFTQTGFQIELVKPNRDTSAKYKVVNIISFGLMRQFSIFQYVILARKISA